MEVGETLTGVVGIARETIETTGTEITRTVEPQQILDLPVNSRTFITMGLILSARPEEKSNSEKSKKTKKKKN